MSGQQWQPYQYQHLPSIVPMYFQSRPTSTLEQAVQASNIFLGSDMKSIDTRGKRATDGVAITAITTDKRGHVYIVRSMEYPKWTLREKKGTKLKNKTSCIEVYSQMDLKTCIARRRFRTNDKERIRNLVVSASGDLYFVFGKMTRIGEGDVTTMCHLPPFRQLISIVMLDDACSSKVLLDCLSIVQEYLCGTETKESIPDIESVFMNELWLQTLSQDVYSVVNLVMDETRRYLYALVAETVPRVISGNQNGERIIYCIRYWDTTSPDIKTHQSYAFGHETDSYGTDADCIDVGQHDTCLYFNNHGTTSIRFASRHAKPGSTIRSTIMFNDIDMHHTDTVKDSGWRCFVGKYLWLWNSKTDQVYKFEHLQYSKPNREHHGYACFADDGQCIFASSNDREHVIILRIDQAKIHDADETKVKSKQVGSPLGPMPTNLSAETKNTPLSSSSSLSSLTNVQSNHIKTKPAETKNMIGNGGKLLGTCASCLEVSATRRCGRCHVTLYCNEACQRADWQKHKGKCR